MRASEDQIRAAGFVPDGKGGWYKPGRVVEIPSERRATLPPPEETAAVLVMPEDKPLAITPPATAKGRLQALGRLAPGEMNKTEKAYEEHLKGRRDVVWFSFEGLKFKLADNTYYTPDFIVMLADNSLEVHEVKGFWTDDARVKIKVAAKAFPIFRFIAVFKLPKKKGGGWRTEEF